VKGYRFPASFTLQERGGVTKFHFYLADGNFVAGTGLHWETFPLRTLLSGKHLIHYIDLYWLQNLLNPKIKKRRLNVAF
jgi:hypothetical protein